MSAGVLVCAVGAACVGLSGASSPSAPKPAAPIMGTLAAGGHPIGPARSPVPPEWTAATTPAQAAAAVTQRSRADRASRAERQPDTVRPVAKGPVTSPFGQRWGRLHAGVDFGVPVGTPVVAVADGVVKSASYDPGGYGHHVIVEHGDDISSRYAHLSRILVEKSRVRAGDVLGRSGSTGHSTGPHLHFELRTGQVAVDARRWLRQRGVQV